METNKVKDIFSNDFTGVNPSENWHDLEQIALEEDYFDAALDQVSESEIAALEKRLDATLSSNKGRIQNQSAFYYLISLFGIAFIGCAFSIISYTKHRNGSENQKTITFSKFEIKQKPTNFPSMEANQVFEEQLSKEPSVEVKSSFENSKDDHFKNHGELLLAEFSPEEFYALPVNRNKAVIQPIKRLFNYRFIRNYKVLNLKNSQHEKPEYLSGTPAQDGFDFQFNDEVNVNYYRKIQRALYFMDKGKYERSVNLFTALQYMFPNDQNLLFYKGLAHFKASDFGYALHSWDKVLAQPSSMFSEEAKWYKALALIELDKSDAAIVELHSIAKSNGFYKKQALSKLSQLR